MLSFLKEPSCSVCKLNTRMVNHWLSNSSAGKNPGNIMGHKLMWVNMSCCRVTDVILVHMKRYTG